MKKLWNKLTAPLPRLSRKGKVVRNLAVTLLIFVSLPFLLDLPVLTADGAFRQAERQFLLAPSEQVLKSGNGYLSQGEDWVAAGQVRRHSSMGPYQKYQGIINNVLPRDELGVVFIPGEENGIYTAAAFGLPEEAVSGVLELTVSGVTATLGGRGHPAEETFAVETDRAGDWLFFALIPHDHGDGNQICILDILWWEFNWTGAHRWPYTLTLLDAEGNPIRTVEGSLPVDQRFLQAD